MGIVGDEFFQGGRAVVGGRQFLPNGRQVGASKWLAPWTAELQAGIDRRARAAQTHAALSLALDRSNRWLREAVPGPYHNRTAATAEDCAKAEKLIAAINEILGDQT